MTTSASGPLLHPTHVELATGLYRTALARRASSRLGCQRARGHERRRWSPPHRPRDTGRRAGGRRGTASEWRAMLQELYAARPHAVPVGAVVRTVRLARSRAYALGVFLAHRRVRAVPPFARYQACSRPSIASSERGGSLPARARQRRRRPRARARGRGRCLCLFAFEGHAAADVWRCSRAGAHRPGSPGHGVHRGRERRLRGVILPKVPDRPSSSLAVQEAVVMGVGAGSNCF